MEGRSLLVSDLDGTLLGDDEALARFAEWYEANRTNLGLVYATGHFFDSVVALVESTCLPEPDAIIGAVGTEITWYRGSGPVEEWPSNTEDWNRNLPSFKQSSNSATTHTTLRNGSWPNCAVTWPVQGTSWKSFTAHTGTSTCCRSV